MIKPLNLELKILVYILSFGIYYFAASDILIYIVDKKKNNKVKDNSPQVRMDKERINDIETLDTSFLEGRITNKKTKAVKEKLLNNKENKNTKYIKIGLIVLAIAVVIVGFYFFGKEIGKQRINQPG